jgi:hypothetical protein
VFFVGISVTDKNGSHAEVEMTPAELIDVLKHAKVEEIDQIRRLLRVENSYTSVKIDPRTGNPKED